jgi:pimeloyl-ACP methyl ester carboxylesterase
LDTFAVAGFSLGGPVAVRAATRHPERVTALVLTATFGYANTRLRLAASTWRELHESGDRLLLAKFLTLFALSSPFLEAVPSEQLEAALQGLADTIPPGTPEHTDLVERADVRDDLAAIRIPTLVISTVGDLLVSPDLHRQLAAEIPGARLVEIDSGHLPFAERPEEWQELITGFLGEHRPAR